MNEPVESRLAHYNTVQHTPTSFRLLTKWFFIGIIGYIVCAAILLIGMRIASAHLESGETISLQEGGGLLKIFFMTFFIPAAFFALTIGVCFLTMIYRCWKIISDGREKVSPGWTVALLFVPVFNIIWQFFAIYGLSTAMNAFAKHHRVDGGPRINEGLTLAACILGILSCPYPQGTSLHLTIPIQGISLFLMVPVVSSYGKLAVKIQEHRRNQSYQNIAPDDFLAMEP